MSWFITTSLGRSILIGLGSAALLLGAYYWVYQRGVDSERAAATGRTLEKIETDRKDRENNDEKARSLDNDAALLCLRNPSGCKR